MHNTEGSSSGSSGSIVLSMEAQCQCRVVFPCIMRMQRSGMTGLQYNKHYAINQVGYGCKKLLHIIYVVVCGSGCKVGRQLIRRSMVLLLLSALKCHWAKIP